MKRTEYQYPYFAIGDLKGILISFLLLNALATGGILSKAHAMECAGEVFLGVFNEYRISAGSVFIDAPTTQTMTSFSCGNFDAFLWSAYNTATDRINEIDVGIGYSTSFSGFDSRIGYARWFFKEAGGQAEVVTFDSVKATGPLLSRISIENIISEPGLMAMYEISAPISVEKIHNITVTPYSRWVYINDYFIEFTGLSNQINGVSLNVDFENVYFQSYINHHNARGPFDNGYEYGLTAVIPF